MNVYSIVRVGSEYIVQAGEHRVLKVASRRMALRVVSDAAELLALQPASPLPGQPRAAPSIVCDPAIMPDAGIMPDAPADQSNSHGIVPEARVMAGPAGVMAERSEAP